MIPLDMVINEEQLLELALQYIIKIGEDKTSVAIVTRYIINNLGKEEFTEEEIIEKYRKLVFDKTLANLTSYGLLEPIFNSNGEISYIQTELGKKVYDEYSGSN